MRLVIDATHIFDGLDGFPTHVAHMRDGSFATNPVEWPAQPALASSLHSLALQWLREDRTIRFAAEETGERRKRGARTDGVSYFSLFKHGSDHSVAGSNRFRNVL